MSYIFFLAIKVDLQWQKLLPHLFIYDSFISHTAISMFDTSWGIGWCLFLMLIVLLPWAQPILLYPLWDILLKLQNFNHICHGSLRVIILPYYRHIRYRRTIKSLWWCHHKYKSRARRSQTFISWAHLFWGVMLCLSMGWAHVAWHLTEGSMCELHLPFHGNWIYTVLSRKKKKH